ncbi:MAG TPA: DUF4258 domain-containing protein [Blastocatellia bacterium]|nr:DUF4258 domain-containing protein [Blastocatellia bacterium]
MFEELLQKMRQAALEDRVYLTLHANRELKNDGLTYDDVRQCILAGEIIEQQRDQHED